jgi:hypothetical protein
VRNFRHEVALILTCFPDKFPCDALHELQCLLLRKIPSKDYGAWPTVAFVMDVDEGGLFRFGELNVQGMQATHRKVLLSAWEKLHGQPYRRHDADSFFRRFFKPPSSDIESEDYVSFGD